FQAEDGIRDDLVTGVQTCALPILVVGKITVDARVEVDHLVAERAQNAGPRRTGNAVARVDDDAHAPRLPAVAHDALRVLGHDVQIGRASCRDRGWHALGDSTLIEE